jgi:HSP20 family protein
MFVRRAWPSRTEMLPYSARLLRDMDRLFDVISTELSGVGPPGVFPAVNITHDADNYYVRAELPGVKADSFRLSVEGNKLSLAGARETGTDGEGVSYHRRERPGGSFDRTVVLPMEFDSERVEARYADGILTITLPMAAKARAKQIAVQTA